MADDIKISGMNNPQTQGGQNSGAQQPAGDKLKPVIDLRDADKKATPTPGSSTPAAAQPAAAASAQGVPSAKRTNAILLSEDEESMQAPVQEKYSIPALVKEKFPDLIQLIKETESMNDEERDYWFQILPIMTEEQIKKFRDILVNEKEQLSNLDQDYENELTKLNEKHMIEWKEFESKEKRKTLTAAEKVSQQKEQSEEEALLKRLSQV